VRACLCFMKMGGDEERTHARTRTLTHTHAHSLPSDALSAVVDMLGYLRRVIPHSEESWKSAVDAIDDAKEYDALFKRGRGASARTALTLTDFASKRLECAAHAPPRG
jgi:hypothetical protein